MAFSGLWLKPQKGAPSKEGPRCDPPLRRGRLPDLIQLLFFIKFI